MNAPRITDAVERIARRAVPDRHDFISCHLHPINATELTLVVKSWVPGESTNTAWLDLTAVDIIMELFTMEQLGD